jgi:hypothetical protein
VSVRVAANINEGFCTGNRYRSAYAGARNYGLQALNCEGDKVPTLDRTRRARRPQQGFKQGVGSALDAPALYLEC